MRDNLNQKAKAGNKEAIRHTYEKYKDQLLTIASLLICDFQQGQEILHDVFVDFSSIVGDFRFYTGLRKYLLGCVTNKVRDRLNTSMYEIVEVENLHRRTSADRVSQKQVTDDEASEVVSALGRLTLQQREAIVLHLKGEMSFRQIARLIGDASVNTVRARYYYGLERLQFLLVEVVPAGANNLQDLIRNFQLVTDSRLDEKILDDACVVLEQSVQTGRGPKSLAGTIIKAAVVMALITFLIWVMFPFKSATKSAVPPFEQQTAGQAEMETGMPAGIVEKEDKNNLEMELKQIIKLIAANDIDGLTDFLPKARLESRLAAAIYLSEKKDPGTIKVLEKLSAALGNGEPNNVFAAAALVLRERLAGSKDEPNQPLPAARPVISGRIYEGKTNLSVADAAVRFVGDITYTTSSDANGLYKIEKVEKAGFYTVTILSAEYISQTAQVQIKQENVSGQRPLVVDFKLERGCMLELAVVNEANEPVPAAEVFVTSPAESNKVINSKFASRTDSDGIFLLPGLGKGSFDVTILHRVPDANGVYYELPAYAPQHIAIKLHDTNIPEFCTIILKKGLVVEGLVQSAGGLPAADMKIAVQPAWWTLPFAWQNRITDFEGRFSFNNIAADTYQIKVAKPADSNDILTIKAQLPEDEQLLIINLPAEQVSGQAGLPSEPNRLGTSSEPNNTGI